MPRALGHPAFDSALPLREKGTPMAATHYFTNLISADSHVMEPYEIWWKALGPRLGDRTPRLLNTYQGRQGTFFYSGNLGCTGHTSP